MLGYPRREIRHVLTASRPTQEKQRVLNVGGTFVSYPRITLNSLSSRKYYRVTYAIDDNGHVNALSLSARKRMSFLSQDRTVSFPSLALLWNVLRVTKGSVREREGVETLALSLSLSLFFSSGFPPSRDDHSMVDLPMLFPILSQLSFSD